VRQLPVNPDATHCCEYGTAAGEGIGSPSTWMIGRA
jgi:hypothetical protein